MKIRTNGIQGQRFNIFFDITRKKKKKQIWPTDEGIRKTEETHTVHIPYTCSHSKNKFCAHRQK